MLPLTLKRQQGCDRDTLGAHRPEISPKPMRSSEISSAGQTTHSLCLPWSETTMHLDPACTLTYLPNASDLETQQAGTVQQVQQPQQTETTPYDPHRPATCVNDLQ